MSSQEITEMVCSHHDTVKTIDHLAKRGVIEQPRLVDKQQKGKVIKIYIFSGENSNCDSLIVAAQLSLEFTGVIIDR